MDSYEVTRVVFSRIQGLDPENAARIMGLLLLQDPGDKEMMRLAFGPEVLLLSLVHKARKDLAFLPSGAAAGAVAGRPKLSPLVIGSPTWAPPSESPEEFHAGELVDEFQLQEHLSFLNDSGAGNHRRSCSAAAAEVCVSPGDPSPGFWWKPCLYFARGFCKNGSSCRFLHGPTDESAAVAGGKIDVEQQCQKLLMRSKSERVGGGAAAMPFSLGGGGGSVPPSPSSPSKCMSFLLHQQSERQRAAAAAAAAMMIGRGDESYKFMGRPWMERAAELESMANPGARQIYLTFPADSTFREEDVSNYFSLYGPVQDVRIPYQQKRMFGFVTFVFPETVKVILAIGNPHFVCDARVLVKPYKEKGKVPNKKQQQGERWDFSGCSTPTGLEARDPYEFQQLFSPGSGRMMFGAGGGGSGSAVAHEAAMLRWRLEKQQQQQQQQELQQRLIGLNLFDLKNRGVPCNLNHSSFPASPVAAAAAVAVAGEEDAPPPEVKKNNTCVATSAGYAAADPAAAAVKSGGGGGEQESSFAEEDGGVQERDGAEHNLPESPFASPTKSAAAAAAMLPPSPSMDMPPPRCFFPPVPSISSGHGALGM